MAANFEQGGDAPPDGLQARPDQGDRRRHFASTDCRNSTSAKIAGAAGHTAASINFHFGSKEALAPRDPARGVGRVCRRHAARARGGGGGRPPRAARHRRREPRPGTYRFAQDRGLVRLPRRVQGARRLPAHLRRARRGLEPDGHRPLQAAHRRARQRSLAGRRGSRAGPHGTHRPAVAGHPVRGRRLRPRGARRQCRAYLCSVFPWLAPRIEAQAPARPKAIEPVVAEGPGRR